MSLLKHMERWRDIEGYEGLYQISSCGRVKSLERYKNGKSGSNIFMKERILKPRKTSDGYLQVTLCKDCNSKQPLIHRLVAQAFIPNPNNLPQVNHKNEDKQSNFVCNLEFCDCKYNINYGSHNERMKKSQINNPSKSKKVLCIETNVIYESTREAERQTGIRHSNISSCCNGKLKTAGGYPWKYVE